MGVNDTNDIRISDHELVADALKGDHNAFSELFGRYRDQILQIYVPKLPYISDANDILQETFVKVYLNLDKYNPEYKFSQWLFTIARNTFIDYTRRKKESIISLDNSDYDYRNINPPSSNPTPEEHMIINQNSKVLDQLMNKLPERYRTIIVMRFFNELSYEEIAEKMSLPIGTVKTNIHRAREQLYKLIISNDKDILNK